MAVVFPDHLYIRLDRSLRADLLTAAGAAGTTVSHHARALLRAALTDRDGSRDTGPASSDLHGSDRKAA